MKKLPEEDALLLQGIIADMIDGMGHGGLSWMARKIGITPTNLKKRLESARGAFDAPTLRAALLVLAHKAEKFDTEPIETIRTGSVVVEIHETEEGKTPAWRPK